ncbi:uncharacterized protein LOC124455893 [Xenia sp. Carnegie-2017]|uniref:uncharacterized protein LOC124455893 n=1 Tax=Xenia sp. Carnegie-2017 TaxID=2897299 RepID=UPI001F04F6C2|nr:uncharacterized protein LOC124455893 [Xenia sp. Carnegie-2017]
MDFAEKFLLESHVSLHKFCSTVEVEYPEMLHRLVKNIYNVLNNGSFDEYNRSFKHQVRSLKFIQKDLIDYRNCPLCPQTGELGVAIHSMDACFSLTHKKLARNSFVFQTMAAALSLLIRMK